MRINMQEKPQGPRAENYPSRRAEYDENAVPVGIPGINHATKEEMDSVEKPTAVDKIDLATDILNDKVDLDTISKLAPNMTNMSICEVDSITCSKASANYQSAVPFNPENDQKVPPLSSPTQECSPRISHQLSVEEAKTLNSSTPMASKSGISLCLVEDDEHELREISIDDGIPSEDKVVISLDCNIYYEKPTPLMPPATKKPCCSIDLRNKQCKPKDRTSSGDDWSRFTQGELQCSQLNKRNEDENGMLNEAGNSLKVEETFPISFKEIDEGNENEGVHPFNECRSGNTTLEKKENILGCLAKYGDRYDEQWYNLVDYSDGSHDKGITSNVNCMDDSFKAEQKEKDIGYSYQENAEHYLSNKFRTRTNPFADSEEDAQFISESVSASVGMHSDLSGIFEAKGKITERGYISHEAELYLSNNFHMRTNPFSFTEEEAQFMPESFASLENHSVSNAQFIPGPHSTSLASHTAASADKSSEPKGKMSKDMGHLSQANSEVCLSEKFQLRTNPFSISEEEAQFMPASFESLESHSVSNASLLTGHVVSEHLSDVSSSKSEGSMLKASDNFQIDPAIVQKVLSEKLPGSEADSKKSAKEPCSQKSDNSTNPYTAENFVEIHTSTAAIVDNEETRSMENQGQKALGCSAFTGSPAGQVCSLEMNLNVPRQSISEVRCDVSDKVNVNDNASEMSVCTHSGPISISGPSHSGQIPLSGRLSYSSGPIPFSGSISTRSDSSTASTRSFAFPILPNESNSSPVKMKQADSRYLKKKGRCRFRCFCF